MHGNMRYDIVPPPPRRRLKTTPKTPQPTTSDHDLRGHWISITFFGLTWVAIGRPVGHMRGGDDARTTGPQLGPSRSRTFPRICPRGTCLDQRDHRQHDALPTSCSPAARFGP
eukprot:8133191-Pyramimonas_sp.AAC.1